MIRKFGKRFLDLLYPPTCIFCGALLPSNTYLCSHCDDKIFELDHIEIGEIMNDGYEGQCLSAYSYEDKIQKLIIAFKFYNKPTYANFFGNKLAEALYIQDFGIQCDIITSVPISKKRERSRGYNQSNLLAKRMSDLLHIPSKQLLTKTKDNKEQHHLGRKNRKENVKDVYTVLRNHEVEGKSILLVDDIVTTGFTLAECAKELMSAGAVAVLCCAIARRNLGNEELVNFLMI